MNIRLNKKSISRKRFVQVHKKQMMMAICMVMMLVCSIFLTNSIVYADEDEPKDWSFYKLSTVATGYFNESLATNDDHKMTGLEAFADNGFGPVTMANAGAVVGFDAGEGGIINWLSSALSKSSNSYSYKQFSNVPTNADGSTATDAIRDYCRYGYLLEATGLDKTAGSVSTANIGRLVLGYMMIFIYILSLGLPFFFKIILSVLKLTNPFKLFGLSTTLLNLRGHTQVAADANGPLGYLMLKVSALYDSIYQLSWWFTIPVSFAILVLGLLIFRKNDTQSNFLKVKRFFIRLLFIVGGIPILGATYTKSLDAMSAMTNAGNAASSRIIASTFVDFESWASNMRLQVPDGAVLASDGTGSVSAYGPSNLTYKNLRDTCYQINRYSGSINGLGAIVTTGESSWDTDGDVLDNSSNNTTTHYSNRSQVSDILDVLTRYAKGAFYTASDYEGEVKSELSSAQKSEDAAKNIDSMFKHSDEVQELKVTDAGTSDGDISNDKLVTNSKKRFADATKWGGYNIFANGAQACSGNNYTASVTTIGHHYLVTEKVGLSTMSMYNYLSSDFSDSGITLYSAKESASDFVKKSHYSVNLIGAGMSSVLYYLNGLIVLICSCVVGYFYGFNLIFLNLKKGFHMVFQVPLAMMGSLQAIAKVITYALVIIVELLGTMFLYVIANELLFQVAEIVEAPFMEALTFDPSHGHAVGALTLFSGAWSILTPLFLIISIICMIFMTVMAMRYRKVFVRSLSDFTTEIVNKFILDKNVQPGATSKPKSGGGLKNAIGAGAGALASGAGMAAGQSLMGNSMGGLLGGFGKNPTASSEDTDANGEATADSPASQPYDSASECAKRDSVGFIDVATPMGAVNQASESTKDATNAASDKFENEAMKREAQANDVVEAGTDTAREVLGGEPDKAVENPDVVQEQEDEARKEKLKAVGENVKNQTEAVAQTGVGVAETVGGAVTKDPNMIINGVSDTVEGANKSQKATKEANAKMTQADRSAIQAKAGSSDRERNISNQASSTQNNQNSTGGKRLGEPRGTHVQSPQPVQRNQSTSNTNNTTVSNASGVNNAKVEQKQMSPQNSPKQLSGSGSNATPKQPNSMPKQPPSGGSNLATGASNTIKNVDANAITDIASKAAKKL